ncbi:baseplate J/gp47 family protein [Delftia sp. UME58]|uniref:baseplate J/gp47 family protein n=1 Tax=Delftia sp. UME58 TaxID=1862322 RepID=UPI0016045F28|nr:baseplate J/gp47 family protein [Delftia sp. UME58]MBB1649329.1 baseplate J protein [Delftia sp. UME58]
MTPALDALPPPGVVETLDFERILDAHRADLLARHPEAAEVLALESEPLNKLLQAHAYRELLYRARVNDAARAHLLAFAMGGDLDHLAAQYGVTRQAGETDDRLRTRLQLRIAALAGQGTREHYEFHAITASPLVRAVRASQAAPGSVLVMLWITDQAQAQAVRQLVSEALNADNARMLGVPVNVAVAVPRTIDITARITRTRTAPAGLLQQLQARLQAAFAGMASLDGSVARSYITTLLHVDGVHAVDYPDNTRPAPITPIAAGEFPALGAVDLIDAGVA